MEYVEILDNNGNDTGRTIDKKEAHRKGYFHHTVHIWIVNDNNEVLLQKRSPRKNPHPDKWDLTCGGHLICNENSIDGAVRELEEEIGIHIQYFLIFHQRYILEMFQI
jgi:isopentenyldiphosphate isomerase